MNHNSNRSRHVSFTNAFPASGSAADKISARWVPNSKEHQPSLASTSIALDSFLYRLFAILSVALISLVLVKLAWGSPLPPNVGLTNGNAIGTKKTEANTVLQTRPDSEEGLSRGRTKLGEEISKKGLGLTNVHANSK